MRTILVAGNWKLNPVAREETLDLCRQLLTRLMPFSRVRMAVCPPFTALHLAADVFKNSRVMVGAQDLYWEEAGAYTGEISAPMLKNAGCTHVIVGHSERRQLFAETNENVRRKMAAALRHDLIPIVCVGETLAQREAGAMKDVVREQVAEVLHGMEEPELEGIVIAYEPVWAIGTGKTATPQQAQEMHAFIRGVLAETFSAILADHVLILYGGSVKPSNSAELLSQPDIDGALVGGASLDAESFAAIVKTGEEALNKK